MFLGVLCLCLSICIYAFVVGEERGKRGGGGGPGGCFMDKILPLAILFMFPFSGNKRRDWI